MKVFGIASLIIAFAMPACAQELTIFQLYRAILMQSSGESVPAANGIYGKLDNVATLPQAEVVAILPLAIQCFRSPKVEVRDAGYAFLISVMVRFDSASLFEPYIDDLAKLADEGEPAWRQRLLMIIGSLNPKIPTKAFEYLMTKLERSEKSSVEARTAAVYLLKAAPNDVSTVHKVLSFASSHPDADFSTGVLQQLGLSRTRLPEAVDFISASLDQQDPSLHYAAVDAASRLDKDARARCTSGLRRIASNPAENEDVRRQAAQVLKP